MRAFADMWLCFELFLAVFSTDKLLVLHDLIADG